MSKSGGDYCRYFFAKKYVKKATVITVDTFCKKVCQKAAVIIVDIRMLKSNKYVM
jgi:hypothetical protein